MDEREGGGFLTRSGRGQEEAVRLARAAAAKEEEWQLAWQEGCECVSPWYNVILIARYVRASLRSCGTRRRVCGM